MTLRLKLKPSGVSPGPRIWPCPLSGLLRPYPDPPHPVSTLAVHRFLPRLFLGLETLLDFAQWLLIVGLSIAFREASPGHTDSSKAPGATVSSPRFFSAPQVVLVTGLLITLGCRLHKSQLCVDLFTSPEPSGQKRHLVGLHQMSVVCSRGPGTARVGPILWERPQHGLHPRRAEGGTVPSSWSSGGTWKSHTLPLV